MKRLLLVTFCFCSLNLVAQNFIPVIKQGSKLSYLLTPDSGPFTIGITVDSIASDYLRLQWSVEQAGTGKWVLKQKSLESATTGRWSELEADVTVTLPDDQSVGILSKAQWSSIQKDKKVSLDMVNYTVKKSTQPLKINDKDADVIYLESEDGTSKLWVLNNAAFPAIAKITGNKAGADAELKSVN